MRKHKRSSSLLATEKQNLIFGGRQRRRDTNDNKRGNGAKDCSLRSLAPRPRLFGVAGMITGICVLGGIAVNLSDVSAVSATLSVPDSVSVNVNPTLNDGFAESIPGEVSVSTSNLAGYTLSIKAKDSVNGNSLVNTNNSNARLNSITTTLSEEQYKNGSNGETYVNTWGFKPDYVDSSPNTSYRPGPDTNGIVLAKTNSDSALDNINLAIAAKVDSSTITGNYTNTFVLTAVPNEAKYNITYNLNGGSGGPGNITETGDIGSSTEIAINGTAPTPPSGKDFLGWCSKNPGTSDTCDGVLVQPGKSLYLCKCDLNITLYALYGKHVSPFEGKVDGESCSSTGGYAGKVYASKCWMWSDYGVGSTSVWNWIDAQNICPTGWHLPSKSEFEILIGRMGGAKLYNAGWSTNGYWTSTSYNSEAAYNLYIQDNGAFVSLGHGKTEKLRVRCMTE